MSSNIFYQYFDNFLNSHIFLREKKHIFSYQFGTVFFKLAGPKECFCTSNKNIILSIYEQYIYDCINMNKSRLIVTLLL